MFNRGVSVSGNNTINNAILGNSITSDNLASISKFDGLTQNDYGATINDPSDADTDRTMCKIFRPSILFP